MYAGLLPDRLPGAGSSVVSGRVAYTLGLEGPAISIDTACSSSLVAMHLAAQALRRGECTMALAGGVTTLATPLVFAEFSRQRGLAPDGRCKSFAETADGAGFSEGVGMLVLERLSDAERNGHEVLALIKGSAVNQDGASNGLTAPNGPSQERVIRQALANAGLEPRDVDAVEAHGTGTTLGDPIEAGALLATYGQDREAPLRLGSVKSNIGHTQAAAGVAGVIKMVEAMRAGVLPKTLHVDAPSSHVDWEAGEIELLSEAAEWRPGERPRRAGVSSFGVSGTNAHVVLEEAPGAEPAAEEDASAGDLPSLGVSAPLALSAKSPEALAESAERLAACIEEDKELDPTDVAFSLATTRSSFEHRATAIGKDRAELLRALGSIASGEPGEGVAQGHARTVQRPVFLFPGQGAQAKGMATGLLDSSPFFAERMRECEQALSPHVEWSLQEVLRDPDGEWLERLDIVQPALWAVMVSLARLWQACGVRPQALIGHSQGEIAAAHIAGALSLDDAALLIAHRGAAMAEIAGQGGMLSVSLPPEALAPHAAPYERRVSLAAQNGPASLVLSGDPGALAELRATLEAEGVRAKPIAVDYAAHSPQIEALKEELEAAFEPISPKSAEIPLISTVTAEPVEGSELTPDYWYRNLRQTVLLEPAIASQLQAGRRAFVEIGPHPALSFGLLETFEANLEDPSEAILVSSLRKDAEDGPRFALSLAEAHASGVELDWDAFFSGSGARRVPLPTYPFQRRRYWLESGGAGPADAAALGLADPDHPFLGAAIEDPSGEGLLLAGRISLATHPWLAEHAVGGTVLFPGTAFLELALRAAEEAGAGGVSELVMQAPLALPEQGAVQLQVAVGPRGEGGEREIAIHGRPEGADAQWTAHAAGALLEREAAPSEPLGPWPPEDAEPLEPGRLYDLFAAAGVEYGPAFQGMSAAWRGGGGEIYAQVSLPEELAHEAGRFAIHPALLDAALQGVALSGAEAGMPFAWREVGLAAAGARELRARLEIEGESVSLQAAGPAGAPLLSVGSLAYRPLAALPAAERPGEGLLELGFEPARLTPAEGPPAELWRWAPEGEAPAPEAAEAAAQGALAAIQGLLADPERAEARLAILTRGAVLAAPGESPDPAAASIWGLVRAAISEHPDRLLLIDTDGAEASEEALAEVLASDGEEPQLALREGVVLAPRLRRSRPPAEGEEAPEAAIDPGRTVLITGATGGLGALFARHLAERHGVRRLLLVSRSGPEAEGAPELLAELEALGAEATVVACDVSDRAALEELLDSIPDERPLGAVVHCAAALDDATVAALGPEQIERGLAAKAGGAWRLHELTRELDLDAFVLFSSAAGIAGGPGQANYAAANVFCDALAQRRRSEGLPATSIAWGLWSRGVGEAEMTRIQRSGVEPIPDELGTALFDRALSSPEPLAVAMPYDPAALRAIASVGALQPIFRGLVRAPRRRAAATGSLAAKLAAVGEAERAGLVLELVRGEVAAVLGHTSGGEVDPGRAFQELGLDSVGAVELRNRLGAVSGLRLPATVVFDYPSAGALAERLLGAASGEGAGKRALVRAQASDEPVAIVGMACRLPGGVSSPEDLWRLLDEGRDAIGAFPADRGWDLRKLYDPEPGSPGKVYANEGGFLAGAGDFDPEFFGISPLEALAMDPQERLLLESSWEALERTGIDPSSLGRSQTGIFAGLSIQDYGPTGGLTESLVSGRVAYTLGLEGPAMTVNTACSSSLVAMHLAAKSLRDGECTLALAGGVTTMASPAIFVEFARQRGLAADGRSKSFADGADGSGFSEGAGVLVLERLSDAERNGHEVLALLKGSAVNQDGASNGITAPNGPSQERVIRQALANAGLEPRDVDAVEAHGTGTTLGDPIEAGALLATYGQERETPLRLGSIKSNIGHGQAAAGVTGVIKTVLAMRAGVLPRTLHVDAPSSQIDWEAGEIELLSEAQPWEADGRPRRAGVSSFGISGTNAHVIVEEPPASEPAPEAEREPLAGPVPLALSAKSPEALKDAAGRLAAHLESDPELDLTDVAHSLLTTRSAFERRAVAIGESREQLLASLDALVRGEPSESALEGRARDGKLAYLLTGQGAQRLGMGGELYGSDPDFRAAFDQVCGALDPHLDTPLHKLLFTEGEKAKARLDDTTHAQPALFALEVSLAKALSKRGLEPDLLAGHSVGEIAAAHIAGVLDLPDAAKLIAARGRLMGELPRGGAMAAIEASEEEIQSSIEGREDELSIAGLNSPTSTVISGAKGAVEQVRSHWEAEGGRTKRLEVSHAFHSPLIEPMLEEFEQVCEGLDFNEPRTPIVSNLTGEPLAPEQAADPAYWVSHARGAVRFADVARTLHEQGVTTFLELGPDPVLSAMAAETIGPEAEAAFLPTLREGRPEAGAIVRSLAAAHASGATVEWERFFEGTSPRRVALPTYPFQRQRFWVAEAPEAGDLGAAGLGDLDHPLLSAAIEQPDGGGLALSGRLSLATHPWLADHAIGEQALLPGAALLELALCAAERAGAEAVEELSVEAPPALAEGVALDLRVSVSGPDEEGRRELSIHSRREGEEEGWERNARGVLSAVAPAAAGGLDSWPPEDAEDIDVDGAYDLLADAGLDCGPAFQGLEAAWRSGEEVYAEAALPEQLAHEAGRYAIHPALLDALLRAGWSGGEVPGPGVWRGVALHAVGAERLRARISPAAEGEVSLTLADGAGEPVATVGALSRPALDLAAIGAPRRSVRGLLGLRWRPVALPEPGQEPAAELLDLEPPAGEDRAAAGREAALAALAAIQGRLEAGATSLLALRTRGAVAVADGEVPDPAAAAVWGLVRSAVSEHPGGFALVDTDGTEASEAAMAAVLELSATESQLAIREGEAFTPRLTRSDAADAEPPEIDPEGTALITGATGGLGPLVARHLAERHGVGHLLLVSRRGPEAKGAAELAAELEGLGCEAELAACDIADREELAALIAAIPESRPLGAVVHCAGTLADATVGTIESSQLESVFAPKGDGAWNLHELTREADISAFVLFSSAAGILGGPGQGSYAAANAFLDALAERRSAEGMAATSIAWGLWGGDQGMGGTLGEAELARMRRTGIEPLSAAHGLELLDAALAGGEPTAVGLPLDTLTLRELASVGALPPLFNGLVRVPKRRSAAGGHLAAELAALPDHERREHVLELVRGQVAALLGYSSPLDVDPQAAFKELGFDSLAAVELRNRLSVASGTRLPATITFDYPTAASLAAHLLQQVAGDRAAVAGAESMEAEVREALASIPLARLRRAGLIDSLLRLAEGEEAVAEGEPEPDDPERIDSAAVEDLIRMSADGESAPTEREESP